MDPALTPKPQHCPLRAIFSEALWHRVKGMEELGASGWGLSGGCQITEGVCSVGMLLRMEIQLLLRRG